MKISFQDETATDFYNNNYLNISISDSIPRLNYVMGDADGEHRFYCGDALTVDDGDLVMKISDTRIDLYKPLYLNNAPFSSGGYTDGEIDTFLASKLTIATPETITGKLNINTDGTQLALTDTTADRALSFSTADSIDCSEATTSSNPAELKLNYNKEGHVRVGNTASSLSINTPQFAGKVLSVLGDSQFNGQLRLTSHLTLNPNLLIYMDSASANKRYIRAKQLGGAPGYTPLDIVNENTSLGRIALIIGTTDAFRVDTTSIISFKNQYICIRNRNNSVG